MKKCNSCNIYFNTSESLCPLCQNNLDGSCDDLRFNKNVKYQTNSLILKILLFISIFAFLLSLFLELIILEKVHITLYIGLGLITNCVAVYYIMKNNKNIYRMFGKYGFLTVLILIIWYMVTKSKLLTNYVIPTCCILEFIFNISVWIILRKKYLLHYFSQILLNIFLLLLPILLVLFNLTSNNIMAYICLFIGLISIIGLFIFFYDDIKEELLKMFNV